MHGIADFMTQYAKIGDLYGKIVDIIKILPCAPLVMVAVLFPMIAFYATNFDSIVLTAPCYCYHKLKEDEMPHKTLQFMWCVLLILLPTALLFAHSSMNNLRSVNIIATFSIGIVIVMGALSFLSVIIF